MCESSPKGDKKKEQAPMRFYTPQHSHYCGIDLHARTMYLCILNQAGAIVLHRNMKADPDSFLKAITPFRDQIVVAVECIFTWYWLAESLRARRHRFCSRSCLIHESHSRRQSE